VNIATWDEPDEPDSPDYASFKQAFKEWAAAQKIEIPARAKKGRTGHQMRLNQGPFEELKEQPGYISGGTLKDYQMDGLKYVPPALLPTLFEIVFGNKLHSGDTCNDLTMSFFFFFFRACVCVL